MARIPNKTDFLVEVDDVGTFTFGRRKLSDEVAIQREYALILDGAKPTDWLEIVGNWIAVFKVMMVTSPPSWDLDEMDPLDNGTYLKMRRVYDKFLEKERSFRLGNVSPGEASSTQSV